MRIGLDTSTSISYNVTITLNLNFSNLEWFLKEDCSVQCHFLDMQRYSRYPILILTMDCPGSHLTLELLYRYASCHPWMYIAQIRVSTRVFKSYSKFTNRRATCRCLPFRPKPSGIYITFSPIHNIV